MKKIFVILGAASLVVFAACNKEQSQPEEQKVFSLDATVEQQVDPNATKTVLDGTSVKWVAGDAIKVFDEAGLAVKLTADAAGASAHFTQEGDTPAGFDDSGTLYAIYPYASTNTISGSTITFTLPTTQIYAANSFGPGANVSVGKISDDSVVFKNVCGVLKLSLSVASGDKAYVGRIELTDDNNWLSGTFKADAESDTPTATYYADGSHTITLDCSAGSGVVLSTTATDFYIVVPAEACSSGFTAKVYSKQNHLITTLSTAKNNTVARKTIKAMPEVSNIPWLPAEYTECEYISTETAGPCINTGVVPYYGMDAYFHYAWNPETISSPTGDSGFNKNVSIYLLGAEKVTDPKFILEFTPYWTYWENTNSYGEAYSGRVLGVSGTSYALHGMYLGLKDV